MALPAMAADIKRRETIRRKRYEKYFLCGALCCNVLNVVFFVTALPFFAVCTFYYSFFMIINFCLFWKRGSMKIRKKEGKKEVFMLEN